MKLQTADLRKLPKVELHRHLDGSVRFQTVLDLWEIHHLDLGVSTAEELFRLVKIIKPMEDLDAVLAAFSTMQKTLCCYDAIKRIAFENVEDAWLDGVRLIELRFSPAFISFGKAIENDEIIEAVIDGVTEGMKKYTVQAGIIGIVSRNHEYSVNEQAVADLIRYSKKYYTNSDRICGLDIADGETLDTIDVFTPFVEQARGAGLGITIHTGENTDAEHVLRSIETYSPERIGHGIKIAGNAEAEDIVREKNILLEISPTSNYLTRSVQSLEKHPLPELLKRRVPVCLNSDDPQLMDIDLVHEYGVCSDLFGFEEETFMEMNRTALKHSFLDGDILSWTERKGFQD